jgi:LysR family transcriptional regulator, benzoate and cis,cis-muconate-responsive activator of ben and cat genes
MELRHLRYFAAVAAHGSFSRAANNLHLTQPALSRQVKDLEDELGVKLLVRGTNSVTLTDAGELFYEEARDLLTRADQAIQRVRGESRTEILRVGYGPSLVAGVMPRAIERFAAVTPRVRIELLDLSPREMAEEATEGRLDVVITPSGFENSYPGFQWQELRLMSVVLIVPGKHPLAKLKKIAPARLAEVQLIGLGRENFPDYATRVRAAFKPFGLALHFRCTVSDGIGALFAAVEAHNAGAIVTDGVRCLMPRSLVAIPFSPAPPPLNIRIGVSGARANAHADVFAKLLREESAKDSD